MNDSGKFVLAVTLQTSAIQKHFGAFVCGNNCIRAFAIQLYLRFRVIPLYTVPNFRPQIFRFLCVCVCMCVCVCACVCHEMFLGVMGTTEICVSFLHSITAFDATLMISSSAVFYHTHSRLRSTTVKLLKCYWQQALRILFTSH